jgi:hypothetical protein
MSKLFALLLWPTLAQGRLLGSFAPFARRADGASSLRSMAIRASHNISGHGPECAVDGDEGTYWLVPGGQRMEAMARDKWLVLDLAEAQPIAALSLLGVVDSFAPARVLLDAGATADGPWRRVGSFRALGAPMRWQRVELGQRPAARFFRLYVRREGHASFRHALHGVRFHREQEQENEKAETRAAAAPYVILYKKG